MKTVPLAWALSIAPPSYLEDCQVTRLYSQESTSWLLSPYRLSLVLFNGSNSRVSPACRVSLNFSVHLLANWAAWVTPYRLPACLPPYRQPTSENWLLH